MNLTALAPCHDKDVPNQLSVVCIYTPEAVQHLREIIVLNECSLEAVKHYINQLEREHANGRLHLPTTPD